MQYMLLIYDSEDVWRSMSEEDQRTVMGEYMAYTEALALHKTRLPALPRPCRKRVVPRPARPGDEPAELRQIYGPDRWLRP